MQVDRDSAINLIRTGLVDKKPVSNDSLRELILTLSEKWTIIHSKLRYPTTKLSQFERRDLEAASSWCINLANSALKKEREYRNTGEITDDYDFITIESEKRLKDFFSNLSK